MEGGEILQGRVCFSDGPQINGLDVLVTLIAKVNTIGFLSLCTKIVKRLLVFIVAEGADHSVDSPLISAMRTEEESFSHFFLQQT